MNGSSGTPAYIERRAVVDGTSTRYLEAGDPSNPTMLLLHDAAWGGSSDVTWSLCIPYLAQRFHIIAPDFLGFGGSDKATYFDRSSYDPRIRQVVGLLTALGVSEPVHAVGSSFGGAVVLRMIEQDAFPMRTAVSIAGTGGRWRTPLMTDELGRWDGSRQDLARVLRFLSDEDGNFEEQLDRRYHWATQPGHYRAVASAAMPIPEQLRSAVQDDWPTGLAGATTPTLLVAGTRDVLFEPEWPMLIAAELKDATVLRMDALHSPNLDQPEALSGILVEFADAHATEQRK